MKHLIVLFSAVLLTGHVSQAATTAFWCDAKQSIRDMRSDVPEFRSLKVNSVTISDGGPNEKAIPFEQHEGGALLVSSKVLNKADFLNIKFQTQSGLEIWLTRYPDSSLRMILPKTNVIINGNKYLGLSGELDSQSDVILNCKDEL